MSEKKLQDNTKIKTHIMYFLKVMFSCVYINTEGDSLPPNQF